MSDGKADDFAFGHGVVTGEAHLVPVSGKLAVNRLGR